jgi:hypothetical protein
VRQTGSGAASHRENEMQLTKDTPLWVVGPDGISATTVEGYINMAVGYGPDGRTRFFEEAKIFTEEREAMAQCTADVRRQKLAETFDQEDLMRASGVQLVDGEGAVISTNSL